MSLLLVLLHVDGSEEVYLLIPINTKGTGKLAENPWYAPKRDQDTDGQEYSS